MIREIYRWAGVRGIAIGVLMTVLLLLAASITFSRGNHLAGWLFLLTLGLQGTIGFLLYLLTSALSGWTEEIVAEYKAEAWAEGYYRGALDEYQDLEPADNPYIDGIDYEGRGDD